MKRDIPHLNIVVAVCLVAVAGYALFSIYAVIYLKDATLTGDVIGTWKSFAVGAFAFWLGSSSGGKAKDDVPAGTQRDPFHMEPASEPQDVTVINPDDKPIPTRTTRKTKL